MEKEQKKNKYIWLNTNEYVREMSIIAQFFYYIGVIKQKRYTERKGKPSQIYTGGFYRSQFGFRWWHPISIIFAFVAFIVTFCCLVFGCIAQAFKIAVYDFHKFEINVLKPLKINKSYGTTTKEKKT